MSVNVYCFGNEMPNSIGAAKGNNQIFLQDNLHFCSAIGWKKLAGKRYNGKTWDIKPMHVDTFTWLTT